MCQCMIKRKGTLLKHLNGKCEKNLSWPLLVQTQFCPWLGKYKPNHYQLPPFFVTFSRTSSFTLYAIILMLGLTNNWWFKTNYCSSSGCLHGTLFRCFSNFLEKIWMLCVFSCSSLIPFANSTEHVWYLTYFARWFCNSYSMQMWVSMSFTVCEITKLISIKRNKTHTGNKHCKCCENMKLCTTSLDNEICITSLQFLILKLKRLISATTTKVISANSKCSKNIAFQLI